MRYRPLRVSFAGEQYFLCQYRNGEFSSEPVVIDVPADNSVQCKGRLAAAFE
jgi:hypothetical protein